MFESLSQEPRLVFSIVIASIVFGTITLSILGIAGMWTWRKHQATRLNHELKADMVAAGMSADEIERVLAAQSNRK